jgi:hypothetical protein
MKAACILRGWVVPSQNVTMRRHWSKNAKERKLLERWIRSIIGAQPVPMAKRWVHVHSVRSRRIADDANLRGGAKGLVDAIVAAGLLMDDSDQWAKIDYTQDTLKGRKAATAIVICDEPITLINGIPDILEAML